MFPVSDAVASVEGKFVFPHTARQRKLNFIKSIPNFPLEESIRERITLAKSWYKIALGHLSGGFVPFPSVSVKACTPLNRGGYSERAAYPRICITEQEWINPLVVYLV